MEPETIDWEFAQRELAQATGFEQFSNKPRKKGRFYCFNINTRNCSPEILLRESSNNLRLFGIISSFLWLKFTKRRAFYQILIFIQSKGFTIHKYMFLLTTCVI